MSKCSSCHAPIFWAHSRATGKPVPVDRTPTDNGNLRIATDGKVEVLTRESSKLAVLANGGSLFTAHFATCPNADQHRKGNR